MLDLTLDQLEEITNNAGPIDGNDGYLLVSFERFNWFIHRNVHFTTKPLMRIVDFDADLNK
jgi:hypothetical protein